MKITKLTLKNFRSHENTTMDLDRFTFIVGMNAAGKSSIAMAIETLLTGRCAMTDSKGAGAEDLVRIGAREFYVAGQVGKQLVERTNGGKSHVIDVGGRSGPVRDMQDAIYRGLGASPDVLAAVLNSGRFVSMDEKSQKQLLAQVLATEAPKIPQEILIDMRNAGVEYAADVAPQTVSDIDDAHKQFYSERTAANRELKALGVVDAPEENPEAPKSSDVWKRMDDLRNELTSKTAQKARLEERYAGALRETNAKRKDLEERQKRASNYSISKQEFDRAQKTVARVAEAAKAKSSLENIEAKIEEKRRAAISEATSRLAVLNSQITSIESQIEALVKLKSADCPSCFRALSADVKRQIGMTLSEKLEGLSADRAEVRGIVDAGGSLADRTEIEGMCERAGEIRTKLREIGDVEEAERTLKTEREAQAEIGRCTFERGQLKDPAAIDTAGLESEIAELNTRIGKGEEVLEQLRDFDRARHAYDTYVATKAKLEERIEALNRLVDFFGPNGIKTSMVGDKLRTFTMAMNAIIGEFGYRISFTLEPYRFEIGRGDGHACSPKQLSESEQFRFGVAFQVALAMVTGLKFVVIDRADVLDSDSRGALTEILLTSELDQAIVLSTTEKNPPTNLPEGVKFIRLEQKSAVAA